MILSNCRQKSYYAGHKLPSWRTFCELDSRRNGSKWATNCLFTRNYAKSPSTGKEFLKSDAGPEWWNELHSLAPRRQGLYAICPSAPLPLHPSLPCSSTVSLLSNPPPLWLHFKCHLPSRSLSPSACCLLWGNWKEIIITCTICSWVVRVSWHAPSSASASAWGAMQKFHQPLAKKSLELLLLMLFVLLSSAQGMTKCTNVCRLRAEMLKFIPKNL